MEKQRSIFFSLLSIFIVDFHLIECKSSGGHYSSQRSLGGGGSGLSSGHGSINPGQQSFYWNNPWMNNDPNSWNDPCKSIRFLLDDLEKLTGFVFF